VIITTRRIRRTLVNKINLLVDSPRYIEASCLAHVSIEASCQSRINFPTPRVRLLRLHRASRCLGMSSGSSCGSSRRSLSTTSPPPRIRVPRHVARLVVDYFASRRLVVDYFAYAARPGASARRVACHAARRRLLHLRRASGCFGTSHGLCMTHRRLLRLAQARHRLLRLRRASRCLGTLRGSSHGSSSTTSTMPRIRLLRHVARLVA
jgi:hypothetical protein